MPHLETDVAVLGSGFGGSLTALLLQKIGRRAVVLDRGRHPRFAIGESSTPVADFILRDVADQYDLAWLRPLACYGTWKERYPHIRCGLKRGFSYFFHRPGERFATTPGHDTELLVAASAETSLSDTHWMRSDVDSFLASQVVSAGIPLLDEAEVAARHHEPGWTLEGTRRHQSLTIRARFVVDATGEAAVIPRSLGLRDQGAECRTASRALFSHFVNLPRWEDQLPDSESPQDYPFPCDAAAVHHVLEEGWMWQLRFDDQTVSAGFALDLVDRAGSPPLAAESEWRYLLARYPSLAEQFSSSQLAAIPGQLKATGRMQRRFELAAGDDWAILPHVAGFVDPLHSTGIAHTLSGVQRLIEILRTHWGRDMLAGALQDYDRAVRQELMWIDELVSLAYLARRDFRLFGLACMLYFAVTSSYERQYREPPRARPGFLLADDSDLRRIAAEIAGELRGLLAVNRRPAAAEVDRIVASARRSLSPFNQAGLLDPDARNMYRHTAAR